VLLPDNQVVGVIERRRMNINAAEAMQFPASDSARIKLHS